MHVILWSEQSTFTLGEPKRFCQLEFSGVKCTLSISDPEILKVRFGSGLSIFGSDPDPR